MSERLHQLQAAGTFDVYSIITVNGSKTPFHSGYLCYQTLAVISRSMQHKKPYLSDISSCPVSSPLQSSVVMLSGAVVPQLGSETPQGGDTDHRGSGSFVHSEVVKFHVLYNITKQILKI